MLHHPTQLGSALVVEVYVHVCVYNNMKEPIFDVLVSTNPLFYSCHLWNSTFEIINSLYFFGYYHLKFWNIKILGGRGYFAASFREKTVVSTKMVRFLTLKKVLLSSKNRWIIVIFRILFTVTSNLQQRRSGDLRTKPKKTGNRYAPSVILSESIYSVSVW